MDSKKKRNLIISGVILAVGLLIVGAITFSDGGSAKVEGIEDTSSVQYQYDQITPSDIKVIGKGSKDYTLETLPQGYTLASPCYSGETLSVYIDGELFSTPLSNYIKAESVTWSYDGSTTLPKNVPEGSYVSPEKFKSSISYADGTTGESEAEYAEVAWAGNTASVTLLVGNTTYVYEFEGSGEDGSVDGDDESTEEYEDQSIPAEVEPLDESEESTEVTTESSEDLKQGTESVETESTETE